MAQIQKRKTGDARNKSNSLANTMASGIKQAVNLNTTQELNNTFGAGEIQPSSTMQKMPIDVAIIRFDDGAVKVVKGNEFLQEFQRRQNDPWWTTIECIQSCVPAKIGIGQLINIEFFAPLCTYNA